MSPLQSVTSGIWRGAVRDLRPVRKLCASSSAKTNTVRGIGRGWIVKSQGMSRSSARPVLLPLINSRASSTPACVTNAHTNPPGTPSITPNAAAVYSTDCAKEPKIWVSNPLKIRTLYDVSSEQCPLLLSSFGWPVGSLFFFRQNAKFSIIFSKARISSPKPVFINLSDS